MNKRTLIPALCLFILLCLTACSGGGESAASPSPSPSEQVSESAAPSAVPSPTPTTAPSASPTPTAAPSSTPKPTAASSPSPSAPITDEEIILRYGSAIEALEPTIELDVSGREWTYGAENDLKNIYYTLLGKRPELKYAYDMKATVSGNSAKCAFSYMPYKTGAYSGKLPAGSHSIGSLHDADVRAQSMIGGPERLSVAITDPTLEVDPLMRACGQAGYGWILYSLSKDGTEIVAAPTYGMTLQECCDAINETFRLATDILGEIVTDGMTEREKAEAVYSYITNNVAYDFRYYSGKNDLPFEATTALGALRDGLAICGGYSHALETMLDMCGIENYTVSGSCKGEYHAWNYVILDGQGYYCDPTADRGGMSGHYMLTYEELTALGGYTWDNGFYLDISR